MTMKQLYKQTNEHSNYLKTVDIVWNKCGNVTMIKNTKKMKSSELCDTQFTNLDPLRPRDALYGGRTNSTKLYHEIDESTQDELKYTLIQNYKRTHNVIYASSKSKNQLMYFLFL